MYFLVFPSHRQISAESLGGCQHVHFWEKLLIRIHTGVL
jgi:hypothetical protein